jgi:hypothetical protein
MNTIVRHVPRLQFVCSPGSVYWCLWSFIVFVSVWDSFLTLLYRTQMHVAELNPIGRLLIDLNGGAVTYLLVAKLLGTILVASILAALYERNPQKAFVITTPIAGFQAALLSFLTFA